MNQAALIDPAAGEVASTNEDENHVQEKMEIETLNLESGALAQCSTPTQPGNMRKQHSLTSEARKQPKKKAQQDSQMVVAQMPQVTDSQPRDQDEGWQTVGKKNKFADGRQED